MSDLAQDVISSDPPVRMYTAPNPGPKTLSGTHTFVIGADPCCVLDPGPHLPAYQEALASDIREAHARPAAILLSHGHPDHGPGAALLKRLLGVPIWASPAMRAEQRRTLSVDELYEEEQVFPVDSDRLRVVPSPGHTFDHVAFWLEGARILFAGDTILGQGTTVVAPPEGDMTEYMATLERMRLLEPRIIAPGHGPLVLDGAAKIDEYVRHRAERERQVLEALDEGPASLTDLVGRVYADVDARLHTLAAGSLQAQLEKLALEGRVRQHGELYERVSPMDTVRPHGAPSV